MKAILTRLLQKRGIKTVNELSPEEKATFDNWELVLSKREMTLDDVRQFIAMRIDQIETKWKDLNLGQDKKAELIPYHTVYKTLLQALNAPDTERAALEKVLIQMIEK